MPPHPPIRPAPSHAPSHTWTIDALRVAAATAVAVFHLSWQGTLLPTLLPIGWVGVQVFFVISGAVILGSAQNRPARAFLLSRVRRLYPAALACCAINLAAIAVLQPWLGIPGVYAGISAARLLGSLVLAGEHFLSTAYWTLPVELAFYLCIAAVLALGRVPGQAVATTLVLLSIPWHLVHILPQPLDGAVAQFLPLSLTHGLLPRFGMYFGLGMILWLAPRQPLGIAGWGAAALAVALAMAEMRFRIVTDIAPRYRGAAPLAALLPVAVAAWALACIAIWAGFANRCAALPPRLARALHIAALATYPFYLLHEAVAGGLMGALVAAGAAPLPAMLAGLAACAAASLAVVTLWERPACRWLVRAADGASYRPWRLFGATMIAKAESSFSPSPLPTNRTSSATPAFAAFSMRNSTS